MNFNDVTTTSFFSGIILMACIHGLLLAFILYFNKDFKSKSNSFLALSIVGFCIILGYEFLNWFDIEKSIPNWILYLPFYIRTTIPVGVFYFVIFLINPKHKLSNYEKQGYVIITLEVVLALVYIPLVIFIKDANSIKNIEYLIDNLSWLITIIACISLLPLALKRVNSYQTFLFNNYSTTQRKSLKWLQTFLIAILVVSGMSVISFLQYCLGYNTSADFTFIILTLGFMVILFWIGYFLVLQYRWFEVEPMTVTNKDDQNGSNKLSSNTQKYYTELKLLIQDKKMFEDVNLTLDNLAEHLQISSGYLSQIIKENEQKNFFEFINAYRVEAVKQKLLDSNYKDYTIMGIALESGFNSKSTFNSVFKKIAKETPSAFKKRQS